MFLLIVVHIIILSTFSAYNNAFSIGYCSVSSQSELLNTSKCNAEWHNTKYDLFSFY